jgi:hypothetical protein
MPCTFDNGLRLQGWRRGETVAVVTLAVADGAAVHVDQQRLVPRGGGPVEQFLQCALVGGGFDVEPSAQAGRGRADRFHRRGAQMRQPEGDAGRQRRASDSELTVRVEEPGPAGGRQDQRKRRRLAENRRGQIEILDRTPARHEEPVVEARPVAPQRNFVVRTAFEVVEDGAREAFGRKRAGVVDAVAGPGELVRDGSSRSLDVDK